MLILKVLVSVVTPQLRAMQCKTDQAAIYSLYQEDSVDAAVVLAVVGDLSPSTPDDLAACGDETELGYVDLDNGTLGKNTELCVPDLI